MEVHQLTSLTQLTPSQRVCLQRGHLTTTADVLLLSTLDLARKCKIVHSEAEAIIDVICRELQPDLHPLNEETCRDQTFTTGDVLLDEALGGGIRTRKLWEIVGESAAGKTQLCLQLSLSVQLSPQHGGLSGAACILSTSWTLPTNRLLEMVDTHPSFTSSMCGLSDIHTVKTPTIPALLHVLSHLFPQFLQEITSRPGAKPIRLLIIDALTELFHTEGKASTRSLVERAKNLAEISTLLHTLADKYNIAVIVVNEVIDAVERGPPARSLPHEVVYQDQARLFNRADSLPGENKREAALGLVWANQMNARIMLSRTKRMRFLERDELPSKRRRLNSGDSEVSDGGETARIRRLTVIFNSVAPPTSLDYIVSQSGVTVLTDVSGDIQSVGSSFPSSSIQPSSPASESPNKGIVGIAPLDIPLAEERSSQLLPSDDDTHPPTEGPEEFERVSQELDAENGPQVDEGEDSEWEAYWRETDLGDDVFSAALDTYDKVPASSSRDHEA